MVDKNNELDYIKKIRLGSARAHWAIKGGQVDILKKTVRKVPIGTYRSYGCHITLKYTDSGLFSYVWYIFYSIFLDSPAVASTKTCWWWLKRMNWMILKKNRFGSARAHWAI